MQLCRQNKVEYSELETKNEKKRSFFFKLPEPDRFEVFVA